MGPRTTADPALVDVLERLVVGAVGLTTVALEEEGAAVELTFPQWRALVVVGERTSGIRVGLVAVRIGASVPATSRLLRRMEDRGLVRSARDESDRRATLVGLAVADPRLGRGCGDDHPGLSLGTRAAGRERSRCRWSGAGGRSAGLRPEHRPAPRSRRRRAGGE